MSTRFSQQQPSEQKHNFFSSAPTPQHGRKPDMRFVSAEAAPDLERRSFAPPSPGDPR